MRSDAPQPHEWKPAGGGSNDGMAADSEERAGNGESLLLLETQSQWEAWLGLHHAGSTGVWLKIAKRGTGTQSVSYAEALESALCYGWIDARKGRYDERYYLQRFTSRRARSIWSRVNRDKAIELIGSGRMRPPGLAAVEAAKESGMWERAYESASASSVPEDFQALLDETPRAKAFFEGLTGTNRYAVLHRIETAVRSETRSRRMAKFLKMLENHETIYPQS